MLNQGRTKTFSELNRLNLKEFLNELNIGFHKEGFIIRRVNSQKGVIEENLTDLIFNAFPG